jgi:hypothetical protein
MIGSFREQLLKESSYRKSFREQLQRAEAWVSETERTVTETWVSETERTATEA